jgi:hypothetical protein
MAERSDEAAEPGLTVFITTEYYIVGDGGSIDEIQTSGRWLATSEPAEVRR